MARSKGNIRRVCKHCGTEFFCLPYQVASGRGLFCSKPCAYAGRSHRPIVERFWEHVTKTEGCWIWNGSSHGFRPNLGTGGRNGKRVMAYRFSWELAHGPIPDGLKVCHNCPDGDNPRCVNPAHLFLGTQADNVADAANKGRIPKGERHHWAKMTDAIVRSIRERYAAGGITQQQLANELCLSAVQVHYVVKGKTWRHVV